MEIVGFDPRAPRKKKKSSNMYVDYSMKLTEGQKRIFERAIELLSPYNKEKVCYGAMYFTEKTEYGDEVGELTCTDEKCIKKEKSNIRLSIGKGKRVFDIYTPNNGDHEKIERCSQCLRPLNSSLTWLHWELDYYIKQVRSKEKFTESETAFDLTVLFSSMPSCDKEITGYQKHQNEVGNPEFLKKGLKDQKKFIERVVRYAEHVIKTLKQ